MKGSKLVRDKIPTIIRKNGKKFSMHIANEQEYEEALWNKLDEEVAEFKAEEEAADILEVINSIVEFYNLKHYDVETARQVKLGARGGFRDRIILDEVFDSDR